MTKYLRKLIPALITISVAVIFSSAGLVSISAQESEDGPESYMVYTEFYQCDWSRHPEADAFVETVLQPVAESALKDGVILGWSYLKRALGDEWGRGFMIRYENGRDMFDIRRDLRSRMSKIHSGGLTDFLKVCSPHRENIYRATGYP